MRRIGFALTIAFLSTLGASGGAFASTTQVASPIDATPMCGLCWK